MTKVNEVGTCQAILNTIRTKVDGSVSITLDVNPEDTALINKLMSLYLLDRKLLTVGFVEVANG